MCCSASQHTCVRANNGVAPLHFNPLSTFEFLRQHVYPVAVMCSGVHIQTVEQIWAGKPSLKRPDKT